MDVLMGLYRRVILDEIEWDSRSGEGEDGGTWVFDGSCMNVCIREKKCASELRQLL